MLLFDCSDLTLLCQSNATQGEQREIQSAGLFTAKKTPINATSSDHVELK